MSYRPVIDSNTASTIDAKALNGAIKSIGGWMGQGKLVPTTDPNTGQTTWSTTGGNFWDMVNGNQAQNLNNMNAMGANQGWLDRMNKSRGVIQGERDAQTVGTMQDDRLNADVTSPNPFASGRANTALNAMNEQLAKQKAMQEAIRKGIYQNSIEAGMQMPGAQLQHIGLQNSGLQQQQNQSDQLFPINQATGQANLDTHMKNLGWIDQLNAAKLAEDKARAEHWKAQTSMTRMPVNVGNSGIVMTPDGEFLQPALKTSETVPNPAFPQFPSTVERWTPNTNVTRWRNPQGEAPVPGSTNQFNSPIAAPRMSLQPTNAPATQGASPAMVQELLDVIRKHKKAN